MSNKPPEPAGSWSKRLALTARILKKTPYSAALATISLVLSYIAYLDKRSLKDSLAHLEGITGASERAFDAHVRFSQQRTAELESRLNSLIQDNAQLSRLVREEAQREGLRQLIRTVRADIRNLYRDLERPLLYERDTAMTARHYDGARTTAERTRIQSLRSKEDELDRLLSIAVERAVVTRQLGPDGRPLMAGQPARPVFQFAGEDSSWTAFSDMPYIVSDASGGAGDP